MANPFETVEDTIKQSVTTLKHLFEGEKKKVAGDVRVAVAKAEAKAVEDIKAATPEVQAAVTAAVKTITDAAVAALVAHGL